MMTIAGSIATLLITSAGLCLILNATRWALRLFAFAFVVIGLPILLSLAATLMQGTGAEAAGLLGGLRPATSRFEGAGTYLLAGIIVLALITLIWFLVRFKIIGILQQLLTKQFGQAAAAETIATYLVRALDGIWRTLKFTLLMLSILGVIIAIGLSA